MYDVVRFCQICCMVLFVFVRFVWFCKICCMIAYVCVWFCICWICCMIVNVFRTIVERCCYGFVCCFLKDVCYVVRWLVSIVCLQICCMIVYVFVRFCEICCMIVYDVDMSFLDIVCFNDFVRLLQDCVWFLCDIYMILYVLFSNDFVIFCKICCKSLYDCCTIV